MFGRSLPYLLVLPTLLTLGILVVYPIGYVIYISIHENYWIVREPEIVQLDNYRWLIEQEIFTTILKNTFIFTGASVFFHLVVGLVLAMLLSSEVIHPRARNVFRGLLIVPWLFTTVVVATVWRLMLYPGGVVNGLLSQLGLMDMAQPLNWLGEPGLALPAVILINVWAGYPFSLLMMLAALLSVPQSLYEAADVDGANGAQKFFKITIPMIKPVIASVALLDAIWSFRLFDLVFLTTGGGPLNATHVLATYTYRLSFESFEFGRASALSVMLLLFTMVLTIFYFRNQEV
jgi:multiple sugar transport system permease protein